MSRASLRAAWLPVLCVRSVPSDRFNLRVPSSLSSATALWYPVSVWTWLTRLVQYRAVVTYAAPASIPNTKEIGRATQLEPSSSSVLVLEQNCQSRRAVLPEYPSRTASFPGRRREQGGTARIPCAWPLYERRRPALAYTGTAVGGCLSAGILQSVLSLPIALCPCRRRLGRVPTAAHASALLMVLVCAARASLFANLPSRHRCLRKKHGNTLLP